MRAFRLAVVSLEAERVLLGLQARRFAIKIALAVAAVVFVLAAFAMLHVLAWAAMDPQVPPLGRAGIILAVDVIVAGVLGFLAVRDNPSRQEIEARLVRDTALTRARATFGLLPLLGGLVTSPLAGLVFSFLRRRRRRR